MTYEDKAIYDSTPPCNLCITQKHKSQFVTQSTILSILTNASSILQEKKTIYTHIYNYRVKSSLYKEFVFRRERYVSLRIHVSTCRFVNSNPREFVFTRIRIHENSYSREFVSTRIRIHENSYSREFVCTRIRIHVSTSRIYMSIREYAERCTSLFESGRSILSIKQTFPYLCICVFVYLCIFVFVYLCITHKHYKANRIECFDSTVQDRVRAGTYV